MDKAKSDHSDRMVKAASIKAEIDRTLAGVEEANAVLQVKNLIHRVHLEQVRDIYRELQKTQNLSSPLT